MEQALTQLGLNAKEAKFYIFLLEEGKLSASEIAKSLNESRTNTYMVLERLISEDLVVVSDKTAVKQYGAADPEKLKTLVVRQQQKLKQSQVALSGVLPQLTSTYQLGQHKPGVAYFEGLEGYRVFQENISKSDPPIDVLASNVVPENKEAFDALQKAVQKRLKKGTKARIIFHEDAKNWLDIKKFELDGYEVRFWGDKPLVGEFVIFGNKVGLTAYQPVVMTTVITNVIISDTFRTIFEQIWDKATC